MIKNKNNSELTLDELILLDNILGMIIVSNSEKYSSLLFPTDKVRLLKIKAKLRDVRYAKLIR